MTVDLHLLIWAAFGLGCAVYLYHLAMTRRRVRGWEPLLLLAVFLVVLLGPLKVAQPTDTADRQAQALEWELQQRSTQPLPDLVTEAPRLSYEERLDRERERDAARIQALRDTITKEEP